MLTTHEEDVFDYEQEEEECGASLTEYDITSSPNDFNVATIFNYIEKGIFIIPGFQRNYVWDISKASKLIESLILGLPIPQIFLYEQERNKFLVIDGQQRLMSIYFFLKGRFPKMEKRNELRRIFENKGNIPTEIFENDTYFQNFELELKSRLPKEKAKLSGLNYDSLGDNKNTLDFRTIRCIVIKQNSPKDDGDSSVFEIFHRLNTGGINLTPQEIRVSLYHSDFMKMVTELNADKRWRRIIGREEPDLRMGDIEVLLRCVAMLDEGEKYAPSMTRFLNQFVKNMKEEISSLEKTNLFKKIIERFFEQCEDFNPKDFGIKNSNKFNISVFESVFYAVCYEGYQNKTGNVLNISKEFIQNLKEDSDFFAAVQNRTTNREQVRTRLKLAREILEKCHESNAH